MEHKCNVQHSKHGLKNKEDCTLNGNIQDNNKVQQELKRQLNESASENKSSVMLSNKLHNNKITHDF